MISSNIDLGQVINAGLVGVVGYFVKRLIDRVERRIDKHEDLMFEINGKVQNILGILGTRFNDNPARK